MAKPFKRKTVNGEDLYLCNKCATWKTRDSFYKSNRKYGHGIQNRCSLCQRQQNKTRRLAKRDFIRDKHNEYRRRESAERKVKARPIRSVSADLVKEALDQTNMSSFQIGLAAGCDSTMIRYIRTGTKTNISPEFADKILTALDRVDLLALLMPETGYDGWARGHRCCIDCGRSNIRHAARGRCMPCDSRKKKGYLPFGSWSRLYERCTNCATVAVKHEGRGLCKICYNKKRPPHQH